MVDSNDLYGPMEVDDDLSTAVGTPLSLGARYSSIGVEMDCYLNAFILSMRSGAKILSP